MVNQFSKITLQYYIKLFSLPLLLMMRGVRKLMIRIILLVIRLSPILTRLPKHISLVVVKFLLLTLLIVPHRPIRRVKRRWFGLYPLIHNLIDRRWPAYILLLLFLLFYIFNDFTGFRLLTLFHFLYFGVGLFARCVSFLLLVSWMMCGYLGVLYAFGAVLDLLRAFGWLCLINLALKLYDLFNWPCCILPS